MSGRSELRVCVVAENASVKMGGEAILPYHYFRVLRSRGVDAWLVVHERSRKELEALFPAELQRIRFVPDQILQKVIYRVGSLFPRRLSEATFGLANQLLTQLAQRSVTRGLVLGADPGGCVVHQPIPVSPRFPSLLWDMGAPVVVGPMNGGMDYPPSFRGAESAVSRFAIALGRSFSNAANAVLPGKRRAAVVLVANERTRAALPSGISGRVVEVCENGVDLSQWVAPEKYERPDAALGFLFIGRLVDWKGLDIAIEAVGRTPGTMLDVIGDGPMLSKWRERAAELGLADRVHFHGWLPQSECARYMDRAQALVLPSLYECGGAVVLEAMAMSKPVIATKWGGPADYLDESCGILIEPASREALVAGFAEGMKLLMDSAEIADRMGKAGRKRLVEHFDWEKKVNAMLAIYESVVPVAVAADSKLVGQATRA
jgi:glycosyltransferase involved in cell wall biosynthesis